MELFAVNRYDETTKQNDPNKEDEILAKLLKKAEKRKRKLQKTEKSLTETSIAHDDAEAETDTKKVRAEVLPDELQPPAVAEEEPKIAETQFQVLGTDVFEKKKEVAMVLPPWLAHPAIISNQISADTTPDQAIENLDFISPQLKQNLKFMKVEKLFPVQNEVIPWILNAHAKPAPFRPRDICVSAPTGSGKTLAFAVPIVQLLSKRVERRIRALVVLPVTELALQVYKVFRHLVQNTSLTVCLFSKAVPFAKEQTLLIDQFKGDFYPKVDIVVTTPGRLVEHLHATKGFCLKSLQFLVVDEADRIMEQLHHNWLYHLDAHVKATSDMFMSGRSAPLCLNDLENDAIKQPHKMLFSATLSQDPEKLQNLRLFQPKLFTSIVKSSHELIEQMSSNFVKQQQETDPRGEFIGKYTTPTELTERICLTEIRIKPLTLYALLTENNWSRFLVFTNTTEATNRLAFVLGKLMPTLRIESLSSAIKPTARTDLMRRFTTGSISGIICSDALARGIDIDNIDVVISYDAPRHIKTYIHRVGRTARAGRQGMAVTLIAPYELPHFNKILADANKVQLPEIKSNSQLEEMSAGQYTKILGDLQIKIEHDKNIKTVRKKNEKKRSMLAKNEEISFLDRLQDDISRKINKDEIMLGDSEQRRERRLKTVRKQKKKEKKALLETQKKEDAMKEAKREKRKASRKKLRAQRQTKKEMESQDVN